MHIYNSLDLFKRYFYFLTTCSCLQNTGSARWDEKKEDGWKDRTDDWKMQQGNLGPEQDDIDPDIAMCVPNLPTTFISKHPFGFAISSGFKKIRLFYLQFENTIFSTFLNNNNNIFFFFFFFFFFFL
jgi:hypothetical protein